jgi:hypothetical protein
MTQREAVAICRRQDSVKLNVAVAALGISRKTADKRRKIDGCIADGVWVIPVTERCLLVASAAVLRVLQLEGSPLGSTRLTQGGNGDGGPASAAVVNVQMSGSSKKGSIREQGSRLAPA